MASALLAPLLFALGERSPKAAQEPETPKPEESSLTEQVKVQLVEVRVLVTDKRGRPITDLRPEEVTVYEGGAKQRLAYVERLSQRASYDPDRAKTPPPAPLYTNEGSRVATDAAAVLPPQPVRRVVFAFDVRNSKLNVREDWREAALEWAGGSMQPEDQAAVVVFQTYPEWVLLLTDDRDSLVAALDKMVLKGNAPNRDRRSELTRMLDEIRGLCTDAGRVRTGGRSGPAQRVGQPRGSEEECSYDIVRPYVYQWHAEANESIDVLRTLTGELAAVQGQKIVILFSEGLIPDAGAAGISAMMSVFGVQKIDYRDLGWRMKADSYRELTALHRTATAADVTFFTFDTRSAADGSNFANLEQSSMLSGNSLALNPWSEMYEATRSTLATLANATGGKAYYGRHRLAENVKAAADSFFGIYTVGYYRSDSAAGPGKLRIVVDRKRTLANYRKRPQLEVHHVRQTRLDLTIGQPRLTGNGDLRELPISLQTAVESLPLRRGAGGYGCQMGVFVQAVRPDGTVADEYFETVMAFVDRDRRKNLEMVAFRHELKLEVPPGSYRLRARLSDDRQEIVADRSVDLTVTADGVEAGLNLAPPPADSE